MKYLFFMVIAVFASTAITAQNKGLEVAKAAENADVGFESYAVDLKMILKNANGQESTREISSKILEVANDGDKSMITFENPRDVKGTAMLTFSHKTDSDDQWLFLPSIKRVKRISSSNKSGPFMGSELSYEDLGSQEVEKYTYKYIKEFTLDGDRVAIIERYPVDEKSGYSKHIAYYNLDQSYRVEKVEYFDRKGALLKTMKHLDYKKFKGKYWRPGELYVVNHQSNKETRLVFSNFNFKTKITEEDFTQNSLKRAN
ncbi:outer membrane lipoprotein-sorting protein [uncultured Aquimarina sp.]|uniref:outer membrane lipoprotein-sorting protein n=1 Tax=uncultured Aquimarina sp. TaxID=575652 RepID=UPI002603F98E|nr:outer membrane lipoprotein-sorting protein [uncultured Aquimarina sp.]